MAAHAWQLAAFVAILGQVLLAAAQQGFGPDIVVQLPLNTWKDASVPTGRVYLYNTPTSVFSSTPCALDGVVRFYMGHPFVRYYVTNNFRHPVYVTASSRAEHARGSTQDTVLIEEKFGVCQDQDDDGFNGDTGSLLKTRLEPGATWIVRYALYNITPVQALVRPIKFYMDAGLSGPVFNVSDFVRNPTPGVTAYGGFAAGYNMLPAELRQTTSRCSGPLSSVVLPVGFPITTFVLCSGTVDVRVSTTLSRNQNDTGVTSGLVRVLDSVNRCIGSLAGTGTFTTTVRSGRCVQVLLYDSNDDLQRPLASVGPESTVTFSKTLVPCTSPTTCDDRDGCSINNCVRVPAVSTSQLCTTTRAAGCSNCAAASDCPAPTVPCKSNVCLQGVCTLVNSANILCTPQTAGRCQAGQCLPI